MLLNLALLLVGRALQMAILLLTLKVMTLRLGPSEVGFFSLLVSIANLFTWLIISPVGVYVNRRTLDWRRHGTLRRNYGLHACYIAFAAVLSAVLLLAGQYLLHPNWESPPIVLATLVAAYMVVATLSNTLAPALNLTGYRVAYSILYTLTLLACLAGSWIAARGLPTGAAWFTGQIAGFSAGTILSLAAFLWVTGSQRVDKPFSIAHVKSQFRIAMAFILPVAAAWTLNWIQFQSYRMMIGGLVSLHFLGLFFAGYSVAAGLMGAVEISANQFFYPYFYKHLHEAGSGARHQVWASYISILLPIMLLLTGALVATSATFAHILLSGAFKNAGLYVAAGAVVEGIRVLGGNYALAAHASMRTHALLIPHGIGAICVAVLVPASVWLFGEQAVPFSMVTAALIFLCVMHIAMTRHAGTPITLQGATIVAVTLAALAVVGIWQTKASSGFLTELGILSIATVFTLAGCAAIVVKTRASLQFGS
jgi:O-antigen/teichoic acid export membrane protein